MKNIKYFLTVEEYSNKEIEYPNISYIENMKNGYIEPKPIIMTSDSNPAAMSICYNQGWAANPYYMTKEEAEAVTSIGDAFNGFNFSYDNNDLLLSFNEFKYFINVTSIDASAFANCAYLSSIEIPNSVTSIGNEAFMQCRSLSSITIPNSVTYIGDGAFIMCFFTSDSFINNSSVLDTESNGYWGAIILDGITEDGLIFDENNLIFCRPSSTSVTIPNSVTYIGNEAFAGCKYLTSIEIPNSVTEINSNAFYDCISLTSVTFDEESQLTSIGDRAFSNCYSLSEITIPNGVTYIGSEAFGNCESFNSITIPSSITEIGDFAFGGCTFKSDSFINNSGLDAEANNYWGSIIVDEITEDGLSIKNNEIIKCNRLSTSVTIPNSITEIGSGAFSYCSLLTSITIPDSVTEIGDFAFTECHSLNEITIGNSVTTISERAFNNCYSLSEITIGNSVTSIGNRAFSYCESLSSITIPNGVTSIDNEAFADCDSLSSIEIPNSVTLIGDRAFYECFSLTSITIPDSVTTIGDYAFEYCTFTLDSFINNSSLDAEYYEYWGAIIVDEITEDGLSIKNNEVIKCNILSTSVTIPDGVTSIGDNAFNSCESLTSITIPDGVTYIGDNAFAYCESLKEIKIPNSVTEIIDYAFYQCSSLTSITIPSGVTSIGEGIFDSCSLLKEITIPSGVTSIGEYAFDECKSLTSITIPNSVTSIGDYAFSDCYALFLVNFEENSQCTSIGSFAFSGCNLLTSITIPNSVTSIGAAAFSGCKSLSEITCLATTAPTVSSNIFKNISSLGVLYYPGLNSSYDTWKQYLPNWDFIPLYTPQECTNLVISAKNVNCRATSTTISYTATTNGVDNNGNIVNGIELTGTAISSPFSQNTDTENEVIRTITFEYLGATASTTITQGMWVDYYYSVNLNDQWRLSTAIANPDSNTYDGVYESYSNKSVGDNAAICTITINGYENFKLYVRSYAESNYDFVVVSNLDRTLSNSITGGTSVKMTTRGNQQSGTAITNYTLVEFSGIDKGMHTIQVMYRKDGGGDSGADQGYLLIPIEQ